jgi:hypothetical protein
MHKPSLPNWWWYDDSHLFTRRSFFFPQRSLNASDCEKGGCFGIPLEQFNASLE